MDVRPLAVSTFLHVCAAAAIGQHFAHAHLPGEAPSFIETHASVEIESSDVAIEVEGPKARPNGTLAGSDRAGARSASGPNREEPSESTTDAKFGMVALVESSRTSVETGADTTWAPRASGGEGLYSGAAIGDGAGVSGLGIGAARDGLGVGMRALGTLGRSGSAPGAPENAREWNEPWRGGWTNYSHYGTHHPRFGPHIGHPARLSPIGPLDGSVVVRVVRGENARLLACYRKALETHPDLAGSLRVDFMTHRDGTVIAAKDGGGSAGYDYALVTCMTKIFSAFVFPESAAFTRVAYAMELHPR